MPFFDELDAMSHDKDRLKSGSVIRDPKSDAVRSVFDICTVCRRASTQLTRDARIPGTIQQLLGGEVCMRQSRINAKHG